MTVMEITAGASVNIDLTENVSATIETMKEYGFTKPTITPGFITCLNEYNDAMNIFQNQMSLTLQRNFGENDVKKYSQCFCSIFNNLFSINQTVGTGVRYADIFSPQSEKKDFMQKLTDVFLNITDAEELSTQGICGVGLRFFIPTKSGGYNEFKVEPFLQDSSQLFLEGTFNKNLSDPPIECDIDFFIESYNAFKNRENWFVKKINE